MQAKLGQIFLSGFLLLLTSNTLAMTSSNSFTVSGVVPVILQASLTRANDLNYSVREVSNNREGYTVIMETDAVGAKYNGNTVRIVDGQAVLTQVRSQDKAVDAVKKLVLLSKPSFVRITIQVI